MKNNPQKEKNIPQDAAAPDATTPEELTGLLQHSSSPKTDGIRLTDEYHPASHHADENPTPALIDEAAQNPHHGLIREAQPGVKISREEEAKLALEHTVITLPMSWTLTLCFVVTIFSVPILQSVVEVRHNRAEHQAQIKTGQEPETRVVPTILEVGQELPSLQQIRTARSPQQAWDLIPDASRFREHENRLQDDSLLIQWTLPRMQSLLVQTGVGNEQAYIGREGWLHYRPDVDYVTSRGFLAPELQLVRKRSGDTESEAVQPDPIKAIVQFKQQLAARGIDLIVVPAPAKTIIHAEKMSSRYTFEHPLLQNPSYAVFRRTLAREGVKLFDPSEILLHAKQLTRRAQFLESDTHWTPQAMELTARSLADFIKQNVGLPVTKAPGYTRKAQTVANIGDIAEMLKLPATQTLYRKQQVQIQQVRTAEGEPWFATRDADILLLGDSFSNIYSFGAMNWGESAGLCEQLSFHLQRPIDSITNNAGGAYATRQELRKQLLRGKDRLHGKRLVIWEFAMRDLLSGDWKLLDLPLARKR